MVLENTTIGIMNFSNYTFYNLSNDILSREYLRVCVKQTWSMSIITLTFLNVITLFAMMYFYDRNRVDIVDRGIMLLALVNTFALVVNILIAYGIPLVGGS